jgi:hypothetical protein
MYEQLGTFSSFTKHSAFALAHWKDDAGWEFASSVNSVLIDHMKRHFHSAPFFPLSCDETTDVSRVNQLSIHVYVVTESFQRTCHLIRLCPTVIPASGATLARQLQEELTVFSGWQEAELVKHFVGIGTDGAAVLQGCHNGVQQCLF